MPNNTAFYEPEDTDRKVWEGCNEALEAMAKAGEGAKAKGYSPENCIMLAEALRKLWAKGAGRDFDLRDCIDHLMTLSSYGG